MNLPSRNLTLTARIERLSEADPNGGCWLWSARLLPLPKGRAPRGRIEIASRQVQAHRASYEAFFGAIPEGMFVLHHCDVSLCVNPQHLYLGTHIDNMRDMRQRNRRSRRPDASKPSRFTGVYPNKRQPTRPWQALIRVGHSPGKMIYLGSFSTEEEASAAYERARAIRRAAGPIGSAREAIDCLGEMLVGRRAA